MTVEELIEGLSRRSAYDHPVDEVEVLQTHISVVFLAGDFVYKVKKPVDLGFLDFTTLSAREHYCHEEVAVNRRLAPDVYLGVVPVLASAAGLRFGEASGGRAPGAGASHPEASGESAEPVDWAVRMRRLPADATMAVWVEESALRPYHAAVLGRRIARFHREAAAGPEISRWGRFEVVAGNARENLEQSRPHIAGASEDAVGTLTPELHRRLAEALDRELDRLEPLIEARAEAGAPRDTHGDLHLDHVYLFADREPPGDIVIIDAIEFNERFRYADPVADIAFLDMDLRFHGREALARVLTDAYFEAAEDPEGRRLLRFYAAYRAAVRAKVGGMQASEPEVPAEDRERAAASARAHWSLALALLEPPGRRPALVLIGGLPGTGKSTLARELAGRAGFSVLSSDITRKRLAGLDPDTPASAAFGAGIYTPEWNERTYAELLGEAERGMLRGERVIVDASFREEGWRRRFLTRARELRVQARFLRLEAPPARVRDRIRERGGGPSDADVDIYEAAARRWEPDSAETLPQTRIVDTGQTPGWSVEQSLTHLQEAGLFP